jgi:hypothetical protein
MIIQTLELCLTRLYTYLVLLVKVCSLQLFYIQLQGAGNVVHHALSNEDTR